VRLVQDKKVQFLIDKVQTVIERRRAAAEALGAIGEPKPASTLIQDL